MNNTLIEFIHKNSKGTKGPLVGVIAAALFEHEKGKTTIGIGWARARNGIDGFNKQRALTIALGRAKKGTNDPIPHSLRGHYEKMMERALRYFKGHDICDWFIYNETVQVSVDIQPESVTVVPT